MQASAGGDIAVGDDVISPPALDVGLFRREPRRSCAGNGRGADGGVLRP